MALDFRATASFRVHVIYDDANRMSASTSSFGLREKRETARLTPSRLASACVVVSAHIAIISWLANHAIAARRLELAAQPMMAEILAVVPSETPTAGSQLIPVDQLVELAIPEPPLASQQEISIDAPRIDPDLSVDIAPYTTRAQLLPGVIATILLRLEIAPDGSVMSAEIVRSNGGDAANAAAIEYAHATRWTPGTIGGEPSAMQASLTVILGERG